jgi:hypothetical protein
MFETIFIHEEDILYDTIKEAVATTKSGLNFNPTRFVSSKWKYLREQNRFLHRFCQDYIKEIDWICVLMSGKIMEDELLSLERQKMDPGNNKNY